MADEAHPAYREENEHLDDTLQLLRTTIELLADRKETLDREVDWGRKHFASNDSESYTSLMVNTRRQGWLALRLRNLVAARQNPYFVRVDFHEDGRPAPERLYIGKIALTREPEQEIVIVDWRAPVAALYYEGRLGRADYRGPEGEISGEIRLKRQLTVENGELRSILDIDITTNDEFLQPYLNASADNRLKDIVATIQAEQNRVIRAELWRNLIVQGAAGSGKTTIALHRIAYLLYNHVDFLKPENCLVIAPSRLFLNYIADVLPDLGVENVRQTTFTDLALSWCGLPHTLTDPDAKLAASIGGSTAEEENSAAVLAAAAFKSSLAFKTALDRFLAEVERDLPPPEDFRLCDHTVVPAAEIRHLFFSEYGTLPYRKRLNRLAALLANRLERVRSEIVRRRQEHSDRQIAAIKAAMPDIPDRQALFRDIIDHKNAAVERLTARAGTAVADYIAAFGLKDPLAYYIDFFADRDDYERHLGPGLAAELRSFLRQDTLDRLRRQMLEMEDLAPLLYLRHRVEGIETAAVCHTVVDEAQDLSPFQFYILKAILKESSFTILGDLCQGLHSYRGVKQWEELRPGGFEAWTDYLHLERSYRATVEIMTAAKHVIRRLPAVLTHPIRPVVRHGEPVCFRLCPNAAALPAALAKGIAELRAAGCVSLAVIGKTAGEWQDLHGRLAATGETAQLLTGKEEEHRGGTVVAPAYLVKGLEFDAVLIADAGRRRYSATETDSKLLYVAMTRALHRLDIYYCGEITPLLADLK